MILYHLETETCRETSLEASNLVLDSRDKRNGTSGRRTTTEK
jgi:hypothetical protein